jgi:hypothetical protein
VVPISKRVVIYAGASSDENWVKRYSQSTEQLSKLVISRVAAPFCFETKRREECGKCDLETALLW